MISLNQSRRKGLAKAKMILRFGIRNGWKTAQLSLLNQTVLIPLPSKQINLHDIFAEKGLQVIVKLANIELTPEKPEYDGFSTREGRLITFPNILQHRVSPFSLADRSKPGHRKILAFFLVNPRMRIISPANIPPQREDWWSDRRECIGEIPARKLPAEMQDMVSKDISAISSMTVDEAKQYRLELMEERKAAKPGKDYLFEVGHFDLCEH